MLSLKEVKGLFAAIEGGEPLALRNLAVLETLYGTGVRRAELIALNLDDLDLTNRDLTVRAGKGDKGRVLPLGPSACKQLTGYLQLGRGKLASGHPDSAQALFLNHRGQRLNEGGLRHLLKELAKRAGIRKQVTPHTLRRTFATHLLQHGASLRHIQALLGHENLNTTAIYLKLDPSELRREVLLKHPRERFEV